MILFSYTSLSSAFFCCESFWCSIIKNAFSAKGARSQIFCGRVSFCSLLVAAAGSESVDLAGIRSVWNWRRSVRGWMQLGDAAAVALIWFGSAQFGHGRPGSRWSGSQLAPGWLKLIFCAAGVWQLMNEYKTSCVPLLRKILTAIKKTAACRRACSGYAAVSALLGFNR